MTCIVGIAVDGNVYLGADSAGVGHRGDLHLRRDAKVFRRGPFLIGFTTSFRMGQLLRFKLDVPAQCDAVDTFEFMATSFIDAVRACLSAGGFAEKEKERESGGTFLVGYRGRLFYVDNDYHVGEDIRGVAACGSGDLIALGVLYATRSKSPKARLELALEAASAFNVNVQAPFIVEALLPVGGELR